MLKQQDHRNFSQKQSLKLHTIPQESKHPKEQSHQSLITVKILTCRTLEANNRGIPNIPPPPNLGIFSWNRRYVGSLKGHTKNACNKRFNIFIYFHLALKQLKMS